MGAARLWLTDRYDRARQLMPGVLVAFTIAAAAAFLGEHYGAPVMLFALLLGIALHFLSEHEKAAPGIEFTAKRLLRIGIALLGARITFDQIVSVGIEPVILVVVCMAATIAMALLLARLTGHHWSFGMLTGGAVAICGASAALALSSVLPRRANHDRDTLFTVIAVTTLSTVAMILYPILYAALGFDDRQIGILIGATVHDVAQVVGAGYAVSEETGDIASYVKLMRVALLPVVVIALALIVTAGQRGTKAPLPWFTLAFFAILTLNSLGLIPPALQTLMVEASRWLLVAAIAALGVQTSLKAMFDLGPSHTAIVVGQTAFLAALAIGLLYVL